MNIELLNKIMNHIEEEPRRFNMETWYTDLTEEVKELEFSVDVDEEYILERANGKDEIFQDVSDIPPCGAVGCLAGTACILSGRAKPIGLPEIIDGRTVVSYTSPRNGNGWFEEGRDALGLTDEQAQRLFFPRKGFGLVSSLDGPDIGLYWPEPFASEYREAKDNPQERVAIVKRRIAHFIATNGAE